MPRDEETTHYGRSVTVAMIALVGLICLGMWGCPHYDVYKQTLEGVARLRESESSRQIAIQEAHARKESAKELAEAEIIRARGVAEANKIIGDSLKDNEMYLRYLWIHGVTEGHNNNDIIYIPTEAGLPILESQRLKQHAEKHP